MLQKVNEFLFGPDNWFGIDPESDFAKAVAVNNKDEIEKLFKTKTPNVRDKHLIEGLEAAIRTLNVDILTFLLSNEHVKNCVRSHPNLDNYRWELANWGLAGAIGATLSYYTSRERKTDNPSYRNPLIYALSGHARTVKYSHYRKVSLQIIDILLKSGLFDVNAVSIEKTYLSSKSYARRHPRSEREEEWDEHEIEYVSKSPFYIACEAGDEILVARMLQKQKINVTEGLRRNETFTTTRSFHSGHTRDTSQKTPLEMASENNFHKIIDLIQKHMSTKAIKILPKHVDIIPEPSEVKIDTDNKPTRKKDKACDFPLERKKKGGFFMLNLIRSNSPMVKILNFANKTNLDSKEIMEILIALRDNHITVKLDLSNILLTPECFTILAETLKINKTLKIIKLTGCFPRNAIACNPCIRELNEALKVNTSLIELDLRKDPSVHPSQFAEALAINHKLKILYLNDDKGSDDYIFMSFHEIVLDHFKLNCDEPVLQSDSTKISPS